MPINTTLNSTVNFSCEATGDILNFLVDSIPANNNKIRSRGFQYDVIGGRVLRRVLIAKASDINNNTNITCVVSSFSKLTVKSDTVFLMIQGVCVCVTAYVTMCVSVCACALVCMFVSPSGLLDSVVNLDYAFINGSSVLLTWTAPYTLDNVPITGYYILNGLVNITTTNNNTNITLSATNPDPCILNNVLVSPINDVGIGSSNNISFYYKTG